LLTRVSDEVQGIFRVGLRAAGKIKAALQGFQASARHHGSGGNDGMNNQRHIDEQTERNSLVPSFVSSVVQRQASDEGEVAHWQQFGRGLNFRNWRA